MNDLSTQRFLNWRRRRDAASLEAVFDATAPALLRLAVHLVGDAAAAEDLVQQTFLAAIEAPERFDAARGVEPWLVGILTHRARRLYRDRAREVDPERLERALRAEDPSELAASAELSAAVHTALDALDEPYREAAVLRLVHGLEPAEIAHALGRAPGTVRVQLHRAMEKLRRTVPAGAAVSLLPLADLEASLAGVRQAVIEAGAGAGAWSGSLAVLTKAGAALMTTKIWIVAAAAAAALVALLLFDPDDEPAAADPAVASTVARDQQLDRAPTVAAERSPVAERGTEVAVGEPSLPGSLARLFDDRREGGRLTVRVHAAGQPVPDRELRVRVSGPDPDLTARWRVTDGDGEAAIEDLPPSIFRIEVAGGIARTGVSRGVESQRIEIDLAEHARVEGLVIDVDGAAVAGARILALNREAPPMLVATSDSSGGFAFDGAGPGLRLVAEHPDYHVRETVWAAATPGSTVELTLLMIPGAAVLEGLALDESGQPVQGAWAELALWTETERARRGEGLSFGLRPRAVPVDTDGRFRFESLPPASVLVGVRAPGRVGQSRMVELEPGRTTKLDLRLSAGATVRGRVYDHAGRPVIGAEVAAPSGVEFHRVTTVTDGAGAYQLEGVEPGSSVLLTARRHSATEPTVGEPLALAAGDDVELVLTLASDTRVTGRLSGPAGEPLVGWWVAFETTGDRVQGGMPLPTGAGGAFEIDAIGDEPGRVVAFPPQRNGMPPVAVVRDVRPGDWVELRVDQASFPSAGFELVIHDEVGAAVRGAHVGYWMTTADDSVAGGSQIADPETGRVRVDLLAPALIKVEVGTDDRGRIPLGELELVQGQVLDLGSVLVPTAGRIELTWTPPPGAPGGVGPEVYARSLDHPSVTEMATRATGDRWRFNALQPGQWTVTLNVDRTQIATRERVVVVSGERLDLGSL